jgi:hypothetical protein
VLDNEAPGCLEGLYEVQPQPQPQPRHVTKPASRRSPAPIDPVISTLILSGASKNSNERHLEDFICRLISTSVLVSLHSGVVNTSPFITPYFRYGPGCRGYGHT